MAERRMFAKAVIGSGKFLRMPATARLLYYDLGMEADDDGIVEAFRVMRTTGATDDDLKILCAKGFVRVLNEELVTQITDWKVNNYIQKDRYRPSVYAALIEACADSDQPVYNTDTTCIQNVSGLYTQDSIVKDRIGQDRLSTDRAEPEGESSPREAPVPYAKIAEHFKQYCPSFSAIRSIDGKRKVQVAARWKANPDMTIFDNLFQTAEASDFLKGKNNNGWKADFDWMMNAGNFAKILEGRYNNRVIPDEYRGSFDTDEFVNAALAASYAKMDEQAQKPRPTSTETPATGKYADLWAKIM